MTTISVAEVCSDIENLWSNAQNSPITVLNGEQPVAVVLSPAEFNKFIARQRGVKAGFAKHLFPGVDMNALLETNIDDVFSDKDEEAEELKTPR